MMVTMTLHTEKSTPTCVSLQVGLQAEMKDKKESQQFE